MLDQAFLWWVGQHLEAAELLGAGLVDVALVVTAVGAWRVGASWVDVVRTYRALPDEERPAFVQMLREMGRSR